MIKVLWIFLIFALTSNTKGFASAMDLSLSIAAISVSPSDYDSTALSASSNKIHASGKLMGYCISTQNISCVIPLKIRGTKGRYDYSVIPTNVEIQPDSPLSRGAGYPSEAWAGVCSFNSHFFIRHSSLDAESRTITDKASALSLFGKEGRRELDFVIPVNTGIQKMKLPHHFQKRPNPGSAIADTGSSSLTLNLISIDPIQQTKITSNNLSDIFIPPKITV